MTTQPELERLAVDFVLGLLDGAELARAETMLAQPAFADLVNSLRQRMGMLVEFAPELPPPPGLLSAIKARIAVYAAAEASREAAADPTAWRQVATGVTLKVLHRDRRTGARSLLLRLAPGAVLPAHPHDVEEACVVLEGAVVSNGRVLRAGSYQALPAGTPHEPVLSPDGALVFLRYAGTPSPK